MIAHTRYTVDRVGDEEWQIFDQRKFSTPLTYLLFVTEMSGLLNCQLTITSYDASGMHPFPAFEEELFSTRFYASDEQQRELLIFDVIDTLMDLDIEQPVELACLFGGYVRNRSVRMQPIHPTN
jgi:hypothetical protein